MFKFANRFKNIDGRWFLGGSHFFLLLISIFIFDLQRSSLQISSAYLTAVGVETLFYKFSRKNKNRKLGDCLFSACTEAAGLLILLKSSFPWFYVPLAALAVSSKYIFRINERQHLFNPTNFAIVVVMAFLPKVFFEVRGDEFNLTLYPILHVLTFGTLAVIYGKTWRISVSYILTAFLVSAIGALFTPEAFIYLFGPEFSAVGLIFIFLMITDPRTTPQGPQRQIVYAVSIALLVYFFRAKEFYYAHYLALFIVTTLRGLMITWEQWKLRKLPKPALQV